MENALAKARPLATGARAARRWRDAQAAATAVAVPRRAGAHARLLGTLQVGWKVKRREMTATSFYFSRLLEFQRS